MEIWPKEIMIFIKYYMFSTGNVRFQYSNFRWIKMSWDSSTKIKWWTLEEQNLSVSNSIKSKKQELLHQTHCILRPPSSTDVLPLPRELIISNLNTILISVEETRTGSATSFRRVIYLYLKYNMWCIYIYIYRERERIRNVGSGLYIYIYIYIWSKKRIKTDDIYIYIYIIKTEKGSSHIISMLIF